MPESGSLFTEVRPFFKRLNHSFIREMLMELSPKACCIFRTVSAWVSPSFWQNLMQYRCSTFSVISLKLKLKLNPTTVFYTSSLFGLQEATDAFYAWEKIQGCA
ncbi:hypothetical protein C0J52_08653 [Blattella germanica]|nr:hypothetical protein C0J52_08653 [Blattella germanica]